MEYLDPSEKNRIVENNRFIEHKQLLEWQAAQSRHHTEMMTEALASAMSPRKSFVRVLSDVLEENTGMGLGAIIVSQGARSIANARNVGRSLEEFGKSIFRRR